MDPSKLKTLLESVAGGEVKPDEALHRLRSLPFEDLGFAKIDHHRSLRQGYPETIFCAGKTPEQVLQIVTRMREHGANVLATRCSPEIAQTVLAVHPDAVHHEAARAITIRVVEPPVLEGYVAVVCAGTSDIPVAEEAVVTAESMGTTVQRVYDVGVAGIHRLFGQRETLVEAHAVIVCAGMEGALPSVVAGLVERPVIAVPTSVGYGASFGGIAALLGMLNSCATGLSVVNIDNGFGAGCLAGVINRLANGL
ncbi:MAG: nickel pincer cofactor biosynthesis protein LarB [FCB group bacterium]|jgi:NCAIR mutase (PurE)-related protein|nr:nickel pincer cofactor biosynthesis protein LarB [FCB group bacterium]